MSQTVVIGGSSYVIPDVGERSWGQNVTDLLAGIASRLSSAGVGGVDLQAISSSPVSVVSGKTYLVDTTSNRTLTLPAATSNAFFSVRDVTGRAWINPITIQRAGSESIDGVAANKTLTIPKGSWLFVCDGTNWFSIRDDDQYTVGLLSGWKPVHGVTPTVNTSGQDAIIQFAGVDVTSQIQIGSRIKFVQSGSTKYGFVKFTSFSTNTLVYVVTPTVGTVGAGAIDAGSVYVSGDDNPIGFPSKFDWVPGVSGVSSTTLASMEFWISGRMIMMAFDVAGTSNSVAFSVTSCPVLFPATANVWSGAAAVARDNSVYITGGNFAANPSTRNILLNRDGAATNWTTSGTKSMKGMLIAPFSG